MSIIGNVAKVVHPAGGTFDLGSCNTIMEAVLGIITRHPMRQEELERALAEWAPELVDYVLTGMEVSRQAMVVERFGSRFWIAATAHYPDEPHNLDSVPERQRRYRTSTEEKA
jgi:hypothetical protein